MYKYLKIEARDFLYLMRKEGLNALEIFDADSKKAAKLADSPRYFSFLIENEDYADYFDESVIIGNWLENPKINALFEILYVRRKIFEGNYAEALATECANRPYRKSGKIFKSFVIYLYRNLYHLCGFNNFMEIDSLKIFQDGETPGGEEEIVNTLKSKTDICANFLAKKTLTEPAYARFLENMGFDRMAVEAGSEFLNFSAETYALNLNGAYDTKKLDRDKLKKIKKKLTAEDTDLTEEEKASISPAD